MKLAVRPLTVWARCPEACVRGCDAHTAGQGWGGWCLGPSARGQEQGGGVPAFPVFSASLAPSPPPQEQGGGVPAFPVFSASLSPSPPPPPPPHPQALVVCLRVFSGRMGVFWSPCPCPMDCSGPGCRSVCQLWAQTWERLLGAPRVTSLPASWSGPFLLWTHPHAEDWEGWPGPHVLPCAWVSSWCGRSGDVPGRREGARPGA